MPLVRIEIIEGKSPEYKKAILDCVHAALVEAYKIPDSDRVQRLYELPAQHFETGPGKTDRYTLIEIIAFPGRSREAKKKLFRSIADNLLKDPGIDGQDLTIIILEPPMGNWGIRGGLPADEVDIGFDINV